MSALLIPQKISQSLLFTYFIHAGMLDAITTLYGLQLGFFELNPLVSFLYPEYLFFMPMLLIMLSYGRALTMFLLFGNHRHFKGMLWFTLYFPPAFNIGNIILYYLGAYQHEIPTKVILF
ncbi:MAG: DUF5658 family protein [Thermoproteota archaeon]